MRGLFALLVLLLPSFSFAQTPLLPVDEALSNPDFLSFRQELFQVIQRRDANALQAVLAPDLKFSFGPKEEAAEAFRKDSNFDDPASGFWIDLEKLLKLGGRLQGEGAFTAPYVFTDWPEDLHPLEGMAVIGSNVRVRKAPGVKARIIARLSHTTVNVVEIPGDLGGWHRVKLEDGREGYVSGRYLRSPLDYRAGFQKKDGRWFMTFFIAGD